MTVTEVKGFGRQKGHTELYRGAEYVVDFIPKTKIEIGIDDDQLDAVIEAIAQAAGSGKIGDGKIFVTELVRAIRIRTSETGPTASLDTRHDPTGRAADSASAPSTIRAIPSKRDRTGNNHGI